MAACMETTHETSESEKMDDHCEIEASVVTGFEQMAKDEILEKLGVQATYDRGKINMKLRLQDVNEVLKLCSVDNLMVVMNHYHNFPFSDDCDAALQQIRDIVPDLDWRTGLNVWRRFFEFPLPILPLPHPENLPPAEDIARLLPAEDSFSPEDATEEGGHPPKRLKQTETVAGLPKFRSTCYRSHGKHSFQSQQASANFGGAVHDYFRWNVDLKHHDIECVLIVEGSHVYAGIQLTRQSLHRRHIVKFGATTLRPTIAYNMLRMCDIQPGEVVCDPMCGSGVIPIEASVNWPKALHLCGDIFEGAAPNTKLNVDAVNETRRKESRNHIVVDPFHWDATNLPLKDGTVDVFITDMPFGKRSGSKMRNWHLYPRVLTELARACHLGTGRACCLTHDQKCFNKIIQGLTPLWKRGRTVGINIGGLSAAVYMLHRTMLRHNDPSLVKEAAAAARHNTHPEQRSAEAQDSSPTNTGKKKR